MEEGEAEEEEEAEKEEIKEEHVRGGEVGRVEQRRMKREVSLGYFRTQTAVEPHE